MSQSPQPTDTQALLQSMLQRLKLQSGRDNQAYLQTPPSIVASSTSEQIAGINSPGYQQPNTSVVNDEVGMSHTSFPSLNNNTDHDTGVNRMPEQATWPVFPSATSGQLFPASPKEANPMPGERTKKQRLSFGSFSLKRDKLSDSSSSMGPTNMLGSTSKIQLWSMKNRDSALSNHRNEDLQMGNGEFGSLEQSTDEQIAINNTKTTVIRRKQRSSENKTRRWTQKIKERWKDRQGSLNRKGKEEGGMVEQMTGQETQSLMKTPDEDEALTAQGEDSFFDSSFRSTGDSEIGLGSFSLLEEIVSGQEWAKFLNPNFPALSTNQTHPKEQVDLQKIQLNPNHSNQSSGNTNSIQNDWKSWSFKSTESTSGSIFNMPKPSHQVSATASMDISERKEQAGVYRQSAPLEAMEGMRSVTQPGLQLRPSSFPAQTEISHSSAGKTRVQTSRKRQHQSAGRGDERFSTETMNQVKVAGSISSISPVSYDVMDESGETQRDILHLNSFNSHQTPLSPSNAFAPALRGVLRHPITRGTESSAEILTKRRRVEENRRVHFSENIVAISPPDLDLDSTESEEESASDTDEDSVAELECEAEQGIVEEQAPLRRTTLPAWILALKRKNSGRKHT